MTEILSLTVVLAGMLGLGLGVLAWLGVRPSAVDGIYALAMGWGCLVLFSTIAAYLYIPLRPVLVGGLLLGGGALALQLWRANDSPLWRSLAAALIPLLPAVLAAVSFASVQFDEFSHWLSNALYLYDHDTLPSASLPNLHTGKQGYPIAIPYVTYAISVVAGGWDERAAKAVPLVLAGLFAVILAAAAQRSDRPGVALIAVLTLFTTLLNPFFDPRLAITTYSDLPTAFVLASMVYALWRAGDLGADAAQWGIRAAGSALLLVQLRETNVLLVLAAGLGALAAGLASKPIEGWSVSRVGRLVAGYFALPLIAVLVWRWHLLAQNIRPDMTPRPIGEWDWGAPLTVLRSLLLERLANNPLAGTAAVVVCILAVAACVLVWRSGSTTNRRLFVCIAAVALAQLVLLAFSFVAVFTSEEVARAASAWRYGSQLGPLLLLGGAVLVPWQKLVPGGWGGSTPHAGRWGAWSTGGILAAVFLIQAAGAPRWRIDCVYPQIRPAYDSLLYFFSKVPPQAAVTIVHAEPDVYYWLAALTRALATRHWGAHNVDATNNSAAVSDYVVDLRAFEPGTFNRGLPARATLHKAQLDSPAIAVIEPGYSCPLR